MIDDVVEMIKQDVEEIKSDVKELRGEVREEIEELRKIVVNNGERLTVLEVLHNAEVEEKRKEREEMSLKWRIYATLIAVVSVVSSVIVDILYRVYR